VEERDPGSECVFEEKGAGIGMSLQTPEKLRKLQETLYAKAKQEPGYRFYLLYDKLYRPDVVQHAWALCRENKGAPGVDGQTFADIESYGVERWLGELGEEVKAERYKPQPVRRVMIPKPGGTGERPLGIPTIRDRVVQQAAVLVLSPIFEADFDDSAYGYRPGRSAEQALHRVHQALDEGRTQVVDADLSKYFDTIPHAELLKSVARRVSDAKVLHLVKMWLKTPVEERDEKGNRRMSGGKKSTRGIPQGGVISPLLANLYMHRYIKAFRIHKLEERHGAVLVNYADDFVVLCRQGADRVLESTRRWMAVMGLSLNDAKTRICDARKAAFDFLGYTFKLMHSPRNGRPYLGAMPSKKALQRFKGKVRQRLHRGDTRPWKDIVDELNQLIRGFGNYFRFGTVAKTRHIGDMYVRDRVRHLLRKRHKVQGRGSLRFTEERIFGELGVLSLRGMPRLSYAKA
jgi:RNA-directed DNA polymerase